jgi:esterase FrsA
MCGICAKFELAGAQSRQHNTRLSPEDAKTMADSTSTRIRERPLADVKVEITKRAGHRNPLEGIKAEDAAAVADRLTSLDPDEWARAWSEWGQKYEAEGDRLAKDGADKNKLRELYLLAFNYFRVARYPCPTSPGKETAYRNSLKVFRKAVQYFDSPLEIVEIPFEGRKLIGYLQVPRGVTRPPVVMHWGGVDGWKEDRSRTHGAMHQAGLAGFAIDMPGTGENPVVYTDPKAERVFSAFIDYLLTHKDIDATRLGVWGGSYGGYWAAKLAHVEAKRLKGAVFHGSNVHYGFQEKWMRPAVTERASVALMGPKQLFESRARAMGVKTLDEFLEAAPKLSLLQQGLLDKPSAPLLCVNGKLDDQAPVEDIYLLMEHGSPKEARIYPEGGHMGRGAGVKDEEVRDLIIGWLKLRLSQ